MTENVAIGALVGVTAFASDADATNNTVTYSLTSNPGGLFAIDASTGVVTAAAAINREAIGASTSITVTATSADGSTASQTFNIAINDVDEFDVSTPVDTDAAADAVDENAAGRHVGRGHRVRLGRRRDQQHRDLLADRRRRGAFAIDANTGVITVLDGSLIDRESDASLNVTVRRRRRTVRRRRRPSRSPSTTSTSSTCRRRSTATSPPTR